jgi:hypothetical protein
MSRLSETHETHIKSLRKEGKKPAEIVELLRKTYPGVKFTIAQVYAVKNDPPSEDEVLHSEKPIEKPKRAYKKRGPKPTIAKPQEVTPNQAIRDITTLLAEIQNGYKLVFKHLRAELLRSRTEVNAMLTGAGIDPIKSDIEGEL